MRRILARLPSRLGRRGAVLVTLGVVWVLIGLSVIGEAPLPPPPGGGDLAIVHLLIPHPIRVALWVGTGLIAILTAWRSAVRRDDLGYMALILMPLERAASYLWSWVVYETGPSGDGYSRGLLSALVYATVAVLVYIISGWPESEKGRAPGE